MFLRIEIAVKETRSSISACMTLELHLLLYKYLKKIHFETQNENLQLKFKAFYYTALFVDSLRSS